MGGHDGQQAETADVATTNDLKNGMTLNIDGNLWTVVEFQHVKPGKGGAFVRSKLKNVMTIVTAKNDTGAAQPGVMCLLLTSHDFSTPASVSAP